MTSIIFQVSMWCWG